ncbi:hypothetical protein ABZ746_22775 [Streptomyces sp. NPDC020096]
MAFCDAGGPGRCEPGGHGVEVVAEESGEAADWVGRFLVGLANPVEQHLPAPVVDEGGSVRST